MNGDELFLQKFFPLEAKTNAQIWIQTKARNFEYISEEKNLEFNKKGIQGGGERLRQRQEQQEDETNKKILGIYGDLENHPAERALIASQTSS